MMLIGTIMLVLGFQTSQSMASTYGLAVCSTMVITTLLAYVVARSRCHSSHTSAGLAVGGFLLIDLTFLLANGLKLSDGGWLSVLLAGSVFVVFSTWRWGRPLLATRRNSTSLEAWLEQRHTAPLTRVPGTAVFLTAHSNTVPPPPPLLHLRHNHVLHQQVVLLTVIGEHRPRIPPAERIRWQERELGFYLIDLHCGFMEVPDVPAALAACKSHGFEER